MDKWLLSVLVASNQFTCNGAEQKKGFRYEPEPFRSTEPARLVQNWYESREIFRWEMAVHVARFPVWDKIRRAEQVNKMSSIDRGLKQYSRNSTCCRIAVCLLLFVWQIKEILAVLDNELENEAFQTFTWLQ